MLLIRKEHSIVKPQLLVFDLSRTDGKNLFTTRADHENPLLT